MAHHSSTPLPPSSARNPRRRLPNELIFEFVNFVPFHWIIRSMPSSQVYSHSSSAIDSFLANRRLRAQLQASAATKQAILEAFRRVEDEISESQAQELLRSLRAIDGSATGESAVRSSRNSQRHVQSPLLGNRHCAWVTSLTPTIVSSATGESAEAKRTTKLLPIEFERKGIGYKSGAFWDKEGLPNTFDVLFVLQMGEHNGDYLLICCSHFSDKTVRPFFLHEYTQLSISSDADAAIPQIGATPTEWKGRPAICFRMSQESLRRATIYRVRGAGAEQGTLDFGDVLGDISHSDVPHSSADAFARFTLSATKRNKRHAFSGEKGTAKCNERLHQLWPIDEKDDGQVSDI